MKKNSIFTSFVFLAAAVLLIYFVNGLSTEPSITKAGDEPESLLVSMAGKDGQQVGTARLTQTNKGVRIDLDVSKLSPGVHAIHVHEAGLCEAPDFKSAGSHFNPTSAKHGFLVPEGPHSGDLPNITADSKGKVQTTIYTQLFELRSHHNPLFDGNGSSLVIHDLADDYVSQPAGAAGDRIACGILKAPQM